MALSIPIVVEPRSSSSTGPREREPITFGLPLPKAALKVPADLRLLDATGAGVPLQTHVLERWPDGSIRWVLLDFQASSDGQEPVRYSLEAGGSTPVAPPLQALRVHRVQDGIVVDTGTATFTLAASGVVPLTQVECSGNGVLQKGAALAIEDGDGKSWRVVIDKTDVEEEGALRTTVSVRGKARRGPRTGVDVQFRFTFFAGVPVARITVAVTNPRRAGHRRGYWSLGSRGSTYFSNFSFDMSLAGTGGVAVVCSQEPGDPIHGEQAPFEIYQDSSGGAHWQSPTHANRNGEVAADFKGYRLRGGRSQAQGLRAVPVVAVESAEVAVAVAMPQFWQRFPKAIDVYDRRLSIRLFPDQHVDVDELQGGERATNTFFIAFGRDTVTSLPLDWCRTPLVARAEPAWYAQAGAVPFLTPAASDASDAYTSLVQAGLDGPSSFEAKREVTDEYGWRDFGDIYADHEAVGHVGERPFISHYNNQYDAAAGFASWFMRTGDWRWWQLMRDLADHVADIDVYHTQRDKAAYNGGMFWHTWHYQDAGLATHRSYPEAPGVPGGGPSPEHCYSTGLLLDYYLTGNRASREAVLGLGQWILDADDGTKSRFRWLDRGPTGLASASGSPLYHGPGRCGANSVSVLLDCHRLSGEERYLHAAEALIRRCVHPLQDIEALNLPDVERRWFYTMFLQSLGKYLEHMRERGSRPDGMLSYARASLLHFARWMSDHERPYLEKPEILEYPNETWAAQDLRKSEVFHLAALHASGTERERFLERAEFFFNYAVTYLATSPTRTLARPMVLLLGNGASRAWFQREATSLPAPVTAPAWPVSWEPTAFVPQKVRALRRLRLLVGAGAAVLVAGAALLFYLL